MKYIAPIVELLIVEDVIVTSGLSHVAAGDNTDNIDFNSYFTYE